jgi:hypothetical protein
VCMCAKRFNEKKRERVAHASPSEKNDFMSKLLSGWKKLYIYIYKESYKRERENASGGINYIYECEKKKEQQSNNNQQQQQTINRQKEKRRNQEKKKEKKDAYYY